MTNFNIKKITSTFLILTMLSHLAFIHDYLQDYVICYEFDGHIQIENVNDCDECGSVNKLSSVVSGSIIKSADCIDIPLASNCLTDKELVRKNNIVITTGALQSSKTTIDIEKKIVFSIYKFQPKTNYILDSYSSVSLII